MQLQALGTYGLQESYTLSHMDGWSWLWMMAGWLAMIVVILLIVRAVLKSSAPTAATLLSATDILASSYARGEITAGEYEERRAVLERH